LRTRSSNQLLDRLIIEWTSGIIFLPIDPDLKTLLKVNLSAKRSNKGFKFVVFVDIVFEIALRLVDSVLNQSPAIFCGAH